MKTKILCLCLFITVAIFGSGCVGPSGTSNSHSVSHFMGLTVTTDTYVQNIRDDRFVPTIFNTRDRFDACGCRIQEYFIDGQWVRNTGGSYGYGGNSGGNSGGTYYNSGYNNGLPFIHPPNSR